MANPEHQSIIDQGVEAWNAWREANEDVLPDLSGADLFEARLSRVNFYCTNLTNANLCGADLSHSSGDRTLRA